MTRTLRLGRWPSGVRIAVFVGLAVVVPSILLIVLGIDLARIDRAEARAGFVGRLEETLRREVVREVEQSLDGALREAAKHVPAGEPSGPLCTEYLRGLEGEDGPFRAVFVVTPEARILDSSGTIMWAERGDPACRVDREEYESLRDGIRDGLAGPDDLLAFARQHPIGFEPEDDFPVTLGFLNLRANLLVDRGSPDAPAAVLDLMESIIRHAHLLPGTIRTFWRPGLEALRERVGDDPAFAEGAARLEEKSRLLGAIGARLDLWREELPASGPRPEVVAGAGGAKTVLFRAPVDGPEGPRFLLTLVLDRDRFLGDVLDPALTGLDLPGGFRAIRLDAEAPDDDLRLAEDTLERPLDEIRVGIVAEAPDAIDAAVRAGGRRNLIILVLGLVVAAAAGWLVVRTVTGELRLAKRTSDFVSNVTHELKTPLTAIRMFVETLQDGRVKDDSERRECLDVIARETDRLQERIERVLKLAQLGAGQGSFDLHPGSLTNVLRDAADTCRARLTGVPGAELVEEIEEDLGPVRLDRRAMGEAVANLLANAVKYSPRDRCRLELVGRTDGDEVVVEVRDHGYGIPASEHERIFERFYRVDEPRVREVEGTGLGLALVRRIVEAHGGRMSLRSAEGEGSTFRIHLPVAAPTVADVRTT